MGSLPGLAIYFNSHSEHLGLAFGNEQGPFFCFVVKSSIASSLETWLGEHDAVEVPTSNFKEEVVTLQAWAEPKSNKNDLMHKRLKEKDRSY